MARKPRNDEDELDDVQVVLPKLPPETIKGVANPEYYRARLAEANDLSRQAIYENKKLPFNYESYVKGIMKEAELAGVTERDLQDRRSEADKIRDGIDKLCSPDANEHWTATDEELRAILNQTAKTFQWGKDVLDEWKVSKTIGDTQIALPNDPDFSVGNWPLAHAPPEGREQLGKVMCIRIRMMLRMRKMARTPVPFKAADEIEHHALAGTELLRFLLYCERSDMKPPAGASAAWSVLKIGYHQVKMSIHIYLAENGLDIDQGRVVKAYMPFKGALIASPPGHGKTLIATGFAAKRIAQQGRTQGVYLHAAEDQAAKNVAKCKQYFKLDNATGMRLAPLYPNVKLSKKDKSDSTIRLAGLHVNKDPAMQAAGVMAAQLGRNCDFQVWDDVVPQTDVIQESVRAERYDRLTGTWLSRMRGADTFLLVIANMWHVDDAVSKLNRDKDKNRISPLILSVGGPDTNPKFRSIWPEVYPPSELKNRYETMRNNALWSAAYMSNPMSESQRLIQELRYYDPRDSQHTDFLGQATFHYSVDPAATSKPNADFAGCIYGAVGDVTSIHGSTIQTYRTLRILDADQFHANQLELAQKCKEFAETRSVDYLHAETRSGFQAIGQMLQLMVGAENVICHDPGNQNKRLRLKNAAPWIDEAACRASGCMASVEFPGMRMKDGTIGPDPKWDWLYDQILKFGAVSDDHVCDALSQLVNHLARTGELPKMEGIITSQLQAEAVETGDPRAKKWLKDLMNKANNGNNVAVEDFAFQAGQNFEGDGLSWN